MPPHQLIIIDVQNGFINDWTAPDTSRSHVPTSRVRSNYGNEIHKSGGLVVPPSDGMASICARV